MKYITIWAFLDFCLYAFSSLALLAVFGRLYMWVTPYNEFAEMREGNSAPAIALGGALLGFTFPLLSVSYHGVNILDFLIWAVVIGIVQVVIFKVMYWLIPMQIEAENKAIAVFYASVAVCVGLISAFSLIPQ